MFTFVVIRHVYYCRLINKGVHIFCRWTEEHLISTLYYGDIASIWWSTWARETHAHYSNASVLTLNHTFTSSKARLLSIATVSLAPKTMACQSWWTARMTNRRITKTRAIVACYMLHIDVYFTEMFYMTSYISKCLQRTRIIYLNISTYIYTFYNTGNMDLEIGSTSHWGSQCTKRAQMCRITSQFFAIPFRSRRNRFLVVDLMGYIQVWGVLSRSFI